MSEEEIKQKAEEYANTRKYTLDELNNSILTVEEIVRLAYITGTHSRDEEISKLQGNVEAMESYIEAEKDCMQDEIDEMKEELNKLRSPWISVEERLPDAHTPVYAKNNNSKWFFALRTDNRVKPWYNIVGRCATEVTRWRPIPEPYQNHN